MELLLCYAEEVVRAGEDASVSASGSWTARSLAGCAAARKPPLASAADRQVHAAVVAAALAACGCMGCTLAASGNIVAGAAAGRRAAAGHGGRRRDWREWATAAAGRTCGYDIAVGGATAHDREWPRAWGGCPGRCGDSCWSGDEGAGAMRAPARQRWRLDQRRRSGEGGGGGQAQSGRQH